MSDLPFPTHVQIQTTTACGAACSICPHPVESPNWDNGLIDEALFQSIVDQLRGRDVRYIAPYLMADPLSDRRIYERIASLRAALPPAHIEVSTTGKYLLPKLGEKLLDTPLSELRISSHGLSEAEYRRTMPGVPFERAMINIDTFITMWRDAGEPFPISIVSLWGLWPRQREAEIEAHWSARGIALSKWRVISRASQVDLTVFGDGSDDPTPYAQPDGEPPYLCREARDTKWLHILSDGRITLCCMDYKQSEILGNVREQTIEAIWNSERYRRVRRIIRGDDPMPAGFLCAGCEWHVSQHTHQKAQQFKRELTAGIAPVV